MMLEKTHEKGLFIKEEILKISFSKKSLEDLVSAYDKRDQYNVKSGYYMALHMKLHDMPSSCDNNSKWWNHF